MSVTACDFVNSTCKVDGNKFATYRAVWQITTNDKTDGPALVRLHPELPQPGDVYLTPYGDTDAGAICVGQDVGLAEEKETTRLWRIVIDYTNNPGQLPSRDPEDPPSFPWNEPPKISTNAVKDKRAILFDNDGFLIASSAGEPYDPVQEVDSTNYMLRIERNLLFADPALNADYTDAINSDPFFGCDPYTVKVETPGAIEKLWFGIIPYYRETWEFAIRTEGWRLRLYDYGMYRKVGTGDTAKLELLRDLHGNPLTAPRLLDGHGAVNPIGASPVYIKPNIANPAQDYFKVYPEMVFAGLNLPQTF